MVFFVVKKTIFVGVAARQSYSYGFRHTDSSIGIILNEWAKNRNFIFYLTRPYRQGRLEE